MVRDSILLIVTEPEKVDYIYCWTADSVLERWRRPLTTRRPANANQARHPSGPAGESTPCSSRRRCEPWWGLEPAEQRLELEHDRQLLLLHH